MAIYHFSAKVIQRAKARSAIAAAAYRSASALTDERLGQSYDYRAKSGVVHSEILLPDGAPERWQDRSVLWNEVEAVEKRKDAVLAREIEFALPRELSKAKAVALARDFVREQFVARGMVADLNVHWVKDAKDDVQPHAHVMLSMRDVENGGFGGKRREWNDVGLLREWRERWAETANERLYAMGQDVRIDHRSLRDQEIDLEPQHKIGPAGARRAERGEDAERLAQHRALARRNGAALLAEPGIALQALTQQQSTFTRRDLARFIDRHTDGAEQFGAVLAKVSASPELVRVGVDERGRERLSTRNMLETERRMEQTAERIAGRAQHSVSAAIGARVTAAVARDGLALGEEQQEALRHVTAGSDLALVVGYAGSGKSTLLGVARSVWEASGYRVRGAALSGIAAEGLQGGSGIASRTLASWEHGWARDRDELTNRDVLVVDEAGMVGSRQLEQVLARAQAAGAKVVLVGDPEQLQAIEAGAAFRALAERHSAAAITEVRRQQVDWQRDATRALATGRTAAALQQYTQAGMVVVSETRDAAKHALVAGWDAARQAQPAESRIILAYTRAEARDLNQLARARMRAGQALQGTDQAVATERGERAFAAGDRILFLRNERGLGAGPDGAGGVAVKNGTLGTVLAVSGGGERLSVRLDRAGVASQAEAAGLAGPVVTFNVRDYDALEHGYAVTVHKAQGVTVDRVHLLATPHLDRHAAYVGLSRHREGVALHYAREDFASPEQLARVLGRERAKDTSLDYDVPPGRAAADALIQDYAARRGLVPDSAIVLRPEAARQTPTQTPRRSRFAGLRLGAGGGGSDRAAQLEALVGPAKPPVIGGPAADAAGEDPLTAALAGYAGAWADAARMQRAGLPVLPHQAQALAWAEQGLAALQPALAAEDARAALQRTPALASMAGTAAGAGALLTAIGVEQEAREALTRRARDVVADWQRLERTSAAAKRDATALWATQAELGRLIGALQRDPPVRALLHRQGRALGMTAGSRLEQAVQNETAASTHAPWAERSEQRLRDAPRQHRGPSLGR